MIMSWLRIFLDDDDYVVVNVFIVVIFLYVIDAIVVNKFDWLAFVLLSVMMIKRYPLAVFSIYSKVVIS